MYVPKELGSFWKDIVLLAGGLDIKRALHIYQKSPTHIPKEPYTYAKGALHIYKKTPTLRKPYICMYQKRFFFVFGKRDIVLSAEDLVHQKSSTYAPKQSDIHAKRALQICQKNLIL